MSRGLFANWSAEQHWKIQVKTSFIIIFSFDKKCKSHAMFNSRHLFFLFLFFFLSRIFVLFFLIAFSMQFHWKHANKSHFAVKRHRVYQYFIRFDQISGIPWVRKTTLNHVIMSLLLFFMPTCPSPATTTCNSNTARRM